jgi:hypothetical protein
MAMLGEILVQKGYITQQQLDGVLAVKGPDAQVGQVLIEWGLLTQEQLLQALDIQAPPPPPPPPPPPVYHQPIIPQAPMGTPASAPDLTMDTLQSSKFKIDLKTIIYIGSLLVSGITMYFTFMAELDTRFSALETGDKDIVVEIEKRITELETKFTPIGDGVYAVDPGGTWPPSRGEYKMKDEMSRTMLVQIQKDIDAIKKDIEKIEKKVFNGHGNH